MLLILVVIVGALAYHAYITNRLDERCGDLETQVLGLQASILGLNRFIGESDSLKTDLQKFNELNFLPQREYMQIHGITSDHWMCIRDQLRYSKWWMKNHAEEDGGDLHAKQEMEDGEQILREKIRPVIARLRGHLPTGADKYTQWLEESDSVSGYLRWLIPELEFLLKGKEAHDMQQLKDLFGPDRSGAAA